MNTAGEKSLGKCFQVNFFDVGNTSLAGFRIPIKGPYFPLKIWIFLSLDHFDSNNFNTRDQPVNYLSLWDTYP